MQSERKGFVPCDHEYLTFRGGKFSKSRGTAVEVPYFLSKYDPDPLRFYLTATAPETRDTELALRDEGSPWEDFVERNNNELVEIASLSSRRSLGQPVPTPEDGTRVHAVVRVQALRRARAGAGRAR